MAATQIRKTGMPHCRIFTDLRLPIRFGLRAPSCLCDLTIRLQGFCGTKWYARPGSTESNKKIQSHHTFKEEL
jgi:hypothetical protein